MRRTRILWVCTSAGSAFRETLSEWNKSGSWIMLNLALAEHYAQKVTIFSVSEPNTSFPHSHWHASHTPINLLFIWIFGCKWISNDILRLYIIILLLYCFCSATCHQSSFVDCTTTSSSSLFVGFVHQRNYVHAMMITIIIIIWIHI